MKLRSNLGPIVVASVIVLCAAQVAVAQVQWVAKGLCVEPGPPGRWDSGGHMLGDVVFDGTTYHMYLVGGQGSSALDNPWSVGHWTWSTLGIDAWEPDPDNPVLEPGAPGRWDGYGIVNIAVLYDGATFHMWYGAAASSSGLLNVGYATNTDGRGEWDKHEDNPLQGLEPGSPGAWDEGGLDPHTVLFDGSSHRMWYTTGSGDAWSIGYAQSTDNGLSWTKHPDPVLEGTEPWEGQNVYLPMVVPYGSGFAMWYAAHDGVTAAIGYAVSPDGIHWGKWSDNPVLIPTSPCNRLDSIAVIPDGDTVHGWVSHCNDIWYVTSPLELVFFDGVESGDTSIWSTVVP